jgi:hypothetical protein
MVSRFVNQGLCAPRDIFGIKGPKVNLNETARLGAGNRCSVATQAAEIIFFRTYPASAVAERPSAPRAH